MEKSAKKEQMGGILGLIERVGNKIPDITVLFIGAFVIVCVVSAILSQISFDYVHPATGKQITVNNMLSGKELVTLMSKMVTNYANFPPLTMVIVATLGIGIADGSGYINTGLKKLLSVTPKFLITPVVILAGMVSHLGPDTGYVIIIPIAAYMFYATGKHPLSGVAASFAGIAGAFSANYTPSAIDPVIQGFTQSAAQIIDPTYQVNVLCNYFYALGSTFLVIASCWWVTEKVVDPWLWRTYPLPDDLDLGILDGRERVEGNRQAGHAVCQIDAGIRVDECHLRLLVVVLVVHILDEVQHVDVQAGQPVQHLDVLGQHFVVVQVLAGDGRIVGAALLVVLLVHAAVDGVQQALGQVGAGAEELDLLADGLVGHAAGDAVVVAAAHLAHQVVVLVLDGAGVY